MIFMIFYKIIYFEPICLSSQQSRSRIYLIKLISTKNYKRTVLLILKDVVNSRYLTLEDFGLIIFTWLLSSVLPECYEKSFVYQIKCNKWDQRICLLENLIRFTSYQSAVCAISSPENNPNLHISKIKMYLSTSKYSFHVEWDDNIN